MSEYLDISQPYIDYGDEATFKVYFGFDPDTTKKVWDAIPESKKTKEIHLLWALFYLKRYPVLLIAATIFKVDVKTYKKYVVKTITELNQCLPGFPTDFNQINPDKTFIGSVDVTRCKIQKPTLECWQYWSGKDKFYALKYEIVVSYCKPKRIILVNGPYKGAYSDISVFRHRLTFMVPSTKLLIGDKGYVGESSRILAPTKGLNITPDQRRMNYKLSKKRQDIERVNKRMKDWRFMALEFRSHDYTFHVICVNVISWSQRNLAH
ncbi:hypothetical protein HK103_003654 [Boothiomyces macroporosus]|uniref:DDE Tnp4 domain-containing protein n=1 Tax=Boothiomyces macroporosus TaxID=261099 RepID=A0AAD5UHL2_9FUNG|nr:hypothetical protein HK103_003654 [Boothiomyces macroporosus]